MFKRWDKKNEVRLQKSLFIIEPYTCDKLQILYILIQLWFVFGRNLIFCIAENFIFIVLLVSKFQKLHISCRSINFYRKDTKQNENAILMMTIYGHGL